MTLRQVTIDRIALTMEGLPLDQAQFVAAQLESALAGQDWSPPPAGDEPPPDTLETHLAGPALVQAVAARLVALVGLAKEGPPWP
mgnify:FL=1